MGGLSSDLFFPKYEQIFGLNLTNGRPIERVRFMFLSKKMFITTSFAKRRLQTSQWLWFVCHISKIINKFIY